MGVKTWQQTPIFFSVVLLIFKTTHRMVPLLRNIIESACELASSTLLEVKFWIYCIYICCCSTWRIPKSFTNCTYRNHFALYGGAATCRMECSCCLALHNYTKQFNFLSKSLFCQDNGIPPKKLRKIWYFASISLDLAFLHCLKSPLGIVK